MTYNNWLKPAQTSRHKCNFCKSRRYYLMKFFSKLKDEKNCYIFDSFNRVLISTLSIIFLLIYFPANAAKFKLDKTRIIFEQDERRKEFRIYNDSNQLQSFRVTLTEMKMHDAGHLEGVEEYKFSAKNYLRIGPRIVRDIPPNNFARIRLIKKGVKQKGEFRSHLMIESLTSEVAKKVSGVFVQPNIKYIIPVFVRNFSDDEKSTISLTSHFIEPTNRTLSLIFKRKGISSFSGNLVVHNQNGKEIYRANQVSIYPELQQRIFRTDIKEESIDGSLLVTMESLEAGAIFQYQTEI